MIFADMMILLFSAEDLVKSLWLMLFGLLGVFSVIVLLYVVTRLLGSIKSKKDNKE